MRITWYGHAAFLIETQGVRFIIDPYKSPDSGGYEPIGDSADVVLLSHENDRYHSHLNQINPPFEVLRGWEIPPEGTTVHGINVQSIPVFETPERKVEDAVTILHFRSEELHLVFLGDLGHPLSPSELAPIRGAEIVLLPTGGPPTIALADIPPLIRAIGPRIVIPMHYKTPKINLDILPPEPLLALFPDVPIDRTWQTWVEVKAIDLPDKMRIVRLEHAR